MGRITLDDNMQEVMVKMADGNPGAAVVLAVMMKYGEAIDPDSLIPGGLATILDLDDMGIYGPRIWMLYGDVCGDDIIKTMGVLRGRQLGFISADEINHAIDNRGQGLAPDDILQQVQERLPNFGQATPETP